MVIVNNKTEAKVIKRGVGGHFFQPENGKLCPVQPNGDRGLHLPSFLPHTPMMRSLFMISLSKYYEVCLSWKGGKVDNTIVKDHSIFPHPFICLLHLFSSSSTGYDECLLVYGDSEGCINIILIKGAGETLR